MTSSDKTSPAIAEAAPEPARSSGVKYLGVRDSVLGMIESLPTGDAIPSERELSARFGVSRMTVRRALDELEQEGYLVRRQGASSVTARPKIAQRMTILSFTEDMRRRGLSASSRLLSARVEPSGPRLANRLRLEPGAPILRIGRLRLADAEPMAIEWLHVPQGLVPGLDPEELRVGSFYEILLERFSIRIAGGSQTVEATVLDRSDARLLDAPPYGPALFVERCTWTTSGQPIEFVQSTYRGDRYQFEIRLTPLPPATRP
jgi:GntR family transcriptional regulator